MYKNRMGTANRQKDCVGVCIENANNTILMAKAIFLSHRPSKTLTRTGIITPKKP